MKAGQNNKYGITKTSGLVQVWFCCNGVLISKFNEIIFVLIQHKFEFFRLTAPLLVHSDLRFLKHKTSCSSVGLSLQLGLLFLLKRWKAIQTREYVLFNLDKLKPDKNLITCTVGSADIKNRDEKSRIGSHTYAIQLIQIFITN